MARLKSQEVSLQKSKSIKPKHYAADAVRHFMERWNNRLTLDNLRLSERYAQNEIHILLHFRFGDDKEYVASFQREMPDCRRDKTSFSSVGVLSRKLDVLTWQGVVASKVRPDGEQQAMFVNFAKAVEMPEDFACPTSVWFDIAYSVYSVLPHSLYFSRRHGFVFRGVLENGEVYIAKRPERFLADTNQMIGQMVKGAPKILDGVPSDEGKLLRDILSAGEIVEVISHVRITINRNFICARLVEGIPSRFQIEDVLFGPFDFQG